MSKKVLKFQNRPVILSASSVVGKHEHNGPLSGYFDIYDGDDRFGAKTWEQSETQMNKIALDRALQKSALDYKDLDVIYGGDLLNQCTATTYAYNNNGVAFFGIFGACSTFCEGLMLSAMSVNAGYSRLSASSASSHFCSCERQFRMPIEYGGQRAPGAQWTVTGAGCVILGENNFKKNDYLYINEALPGTIIDYGISDANSMGAAMAPAAADTLARYFELTGLNPDSFDLIATGDLGADGHNLAKELLKERNIIMGENFTDCGLLIYDLEKQDKHSGGSGCGCSAVVTSGYFMDKFARKEFKDILVVATGALLSPMFIMQKLTIPSIAHLVRITRHF